MNSNGTNPQGTWPTTVLSSSAAVSAFGPFGRWWVLPAPSPRVGCSELGPPWAALLKTSPRAPRDTGSCPPIPTFSAGPPVPKPLEGPGFWGPPLSCSPAPLLPTADVAAPPCAPPPHGAHLPGAPWSGVHVGPTPARLFSRVSRSELPDQASGCGQTSRLSPCDPPQRHQPVSRPRGRPGQLLLCLQWRWV